MSVTITIITFHRACPTSWRENSWHKYGMKKLRHCHPMYRIFTSPAAAVSKCCDEDVCLCVCLSLREHISGATRAIFTNFFVLVTCGRGSVLLRRGDEILMGRGNFARFPRHSQCIVTRSLQITSCSRRDHSVAVTG